MSTFPKEGIKKLNEIIKDLRSQVRAKDKIIRDLTDELNNLTKPTRTRKPQEAKQTHEEWRKEFIKRMKEKKP